MNNLTRDKVPLYTQIKDILLDRILHGVYSMGESIPTEKQLEKEFSVSKITIRNAIKELVEDGYLMPKSGKGTKVIRNTPSTLVTSGKQFTETLVEKGHKIQKHLIEVRNIKNQEGTNLFNLFGDYCLCLERLYFLDGSPYVHYTHYLYKELAENIFEGYEGLSLYQVIKDQGINMKKFRDQFDVAEVSQTVADRLQVERGSFLLKRERYSYDDYDLLIEYSEGYYNTNRQKYLIDYDA